LIQTLQSGDEIIAGATQLLREEGLLDAKAMVAQDASVLLKAAQTAAAIAAAEAEAAAAEAAAALEAEAAEAAAAAGGAAALGDVKLVIDAIRRSPLMLELEPTHPGLAAIADMPEDLVVDAVTYLVREVGWMEAKKYVSEDAEVLGEAADEVVAIREAEAAAAAAAAAEAEAAALLEAQEQEAIPLAGLSNGRH
jgi:colicin import membrane protein